jgi:hypothetical protein
MPGPRFILGPGMTQLLRAASSVVVDNSVQSMIRIKPAFGLDPRVETGFPKRSCSVKMLERQLIQSRTIPL